MRSYCLYNGNIVDIAEIYEVREGKQINIPEKLDYYRKLSKSKQLFCPCGCGSVVVLVAGEKNIRRQHFRLLDKFGNIDCNYQEESGISIRSKMMLKCWLVKNLPTGSSQIKYRVPISKLVENNRRYELSVYSEDYDIGIVYNKSVSAILEEKVEILSEYMKSKIIYVTRIENEGTDGQYPEHMMRVQERQGYCFYLDMTEESLYEEVTAKISIYEKNSLGFWKTLTICEGDLEEFELRSDGSMVFKGELLSELVAKRKNSFKEEQEKASERICLERQEKEKREEERMRLEREECERREEERKQKEKERKERYEEQQKLFLQEHPKFAKIYNLLITMKSIKGDFISDQGDGSTKRRSGTLQINNVKISIKNYRIEISKDSSNKIYLYIIDNDYRCQRPKTGVLYKMLDYRNVDNVEERFRTDFSCVF